MTKSKRQGYKVGASIFKNKANAEKAEAARASLKQAVNREGMTAAEREDAFKAFFNIKE